MYFCKYTDASLRSALHEFSNFKSFSLVLFMTLILSIIFAVLPLLGIVYTVLSGALDTVDSLFLILILLTISAVFGLNILLDLRARGMLKFGKKAAPAPAAPAKAAAQTSQKAT
jgi:hypothetical protein